MDKLLAVELLGSVGIFFGGVFFHFLYKYIGKHPIYGIISPVNESIWEHLKIAFYPALVYSVLEMWVIGSVVTNYWTAELIGIYAMIATVLLLEWIYPAILKRNILILDLGVFLAAIVISQLVSYALMTDPRLYFNFPSPIVVGILLIQTAVFGFLTFYPPKLPLWRDSITGKYGVLPPAK